MSLLSHRTPLRHAVLAAVTAAAIYLPATSAFADTAPTPAPAVADQAPGTPAPDRTAAQDKDAPSAAPVPDRAAAEPAVQAPRGGVAAGDRPAPAPSAVQPSAAPRGGVAAGEQPVASRDVTNVAVGSAAGFALLLAGAATLVLRRRSATRVDG